MACVGGPAAPPPPLSPVLCEGRRRLDAFSRSVASALVQGEGAYLTRAISLACDSTELESDTLTLALVDGSFFALLRAFQRACRTGMPAHAMLPLVDHLADAIRDGPLPTLARLSRHAGAPTASNDRFLAAANSAECASAYSLRLRSVVAEGFMTHAPELGFQAAPGLARLEALASSFGASAKRAMAELAAALLPTAWLLLEYETADYRLAAAGEAAETRLRLQFEHGVLRPLNRSLAYLQGRLRPANLDWLVHAIGCGLASSLETGALAKQFDELGAMLFSEHVRRLADALAQASAATVRNDLGRLTQLAFLLNAGSVNEAAGLLLSQLASGATGGAGGGAGRAAGAAAGGSNRLTPQEAGRVLSLRIDFDRAEVRELLGVYFDMGFDEIEDEQASAAAAAAGSGTAAVSPAAPVAGARLEVDAANVEAGGARAAAQQAKALAGTVASASASRALLMGRGLFNAGRELLREAALEN
jgi:hypothetical protein